MSFPDPTTLRVAVSEGPLYRLRERFEDAGIGGGYDGPEGVAKMLLEHVKKKRGQAQSAASDETVAEEEKSSSINDGGNGSKSNRNSKGDTSDGGCSKQEPHEVIDVA